MEGKTMTDWRRATPQEFVKVSTPIGALFHMFPGAIYEHRDRIWRVKDMRGTVEVDDMLSPAFKQLQLSLKAKGYKLQAVTLPQRGISELFPKTWFCGSCGHFESGLLNSIHCSECRAEMRQFPFIVTCDECGYIDGVRLPRCTRCNSDKHITWVAKNRSQPATYHFACSQCARNQGIQNLSQQPWARVEGFIVYSDLEISGSCPRCQAKTSRNAVPGKKVMPATSTSFMIPAFERTFDRDVAEMIKEPITTAKNELVGEWEPTFEYIQRTLGIKDVYLKDIKVLAATYGYKVGERSKILQFPNNTVFIKPSRATAAIFEFDAQRLAAYNKEEVLHSIAHALVTTAGYVTGLGPDAFDEYVDPKNNAVMIFTEQPGGCEMLVRVPEKLVMLLRQSHSLTDRKSVV